MLSRTPSVIWNLMLAKMTSTNHSRRVVTFSNDSVQLLRPIPHCSDVNAKIVVSGSGGDRKRVPKKKTQRGSIRVSKAPRKKIFRKEIGSGLSPFEGRDCCALQKNVLSALVLESRGLRQY